MHKAKIINDLLNRMLQSTSLKLLHKVYGNYKPSKEVFCLALEVYLLEKENNLK